LDMTRKSVYLFSTDIILFCFVFGVFGLLYA
jgi:hypothetical protein